MIHIDNDVISEVKNKVKKCLRFYKQIGLVKSKKQISEDISGIFECVMQSSYSDVRAPKNDSEPDLYVGDIPIEIKTTSTTSWRGGSLSKRSGYFVMISWEMQGENINLFIAGVELKEKDWKKLSNGYYATSFTKGELIDRKIDIYCGDIYKYNRGLSDCVRINYN